MRPRPGPRQGGERPEVVGAGQREPVINGILVENACRPPPPPCPATPSSQRPARRWPAPRRRPRRNPASATKPPAKAAVGFWRAAVQDASGRGSESRSLGSGPTATSSAATTSAMRRAIGPLVDRCGHSGACVTTHRYPAERRLHPREPTTRRRDPDRTSPVGAGGQRHHARSDCRCTSARGSARGVVQAPRVERGSEERVVGVGLPAQLRRVRLSHHHAPGRDQPGHQR